MPTLFERSQTARAGLERARLANLTRQQLSALQARASEWNALRSTRASVCKGMAVFPDHFRKSPPELAHANASTAALASEARELLCKGADVHALSENHLWTRLLAAAETANKEAEAALQSAWRNSLSDLGAVESPAALEARMPRTPANDRLLGEYRALYSQYQTLVRQGPLAATSVLQDLTRKVERLREVQAGITLSAPENVCVFLRAVQQGTAHIELLTPEVLEWLRANDDPSRFVIKLRATPTWS